MWADKTSNPGNHIVEVDKNTPTEITLHAEVSDNAGDVSNVQFVNADDPGTPLECKQPQASQFECTIEVNLSQETTYQATITTAAGSESTSLTLAVKAPALRGDQNDADPDDDADDDADDLGIVEVRTFLYKETQTGGHPYSDKYVYEGAPYKGKFNRAYGFIHLCDNRFYDANGEEVINDDLIINYRNAVPVEFYKWSVDDGDTGWVKIDNPKIDPDHGFVFPSTYTKTPIKYKAVCPVSNADPALLANVTKRTLDDAEMTVYVAKEVSSDMNNKELGGTATFTIKYNGDPSRLYAAEVDKNSGTKKLTKPHTVTRDGQTYTLTLTNITRDMHNKDYGFRIDEGEDNYIYLTETLKIKGMSDSDGAKVALANTGSSTALLLASAFVLMAGGAVVLRRRALR